MGVEIFGHTIQVGKVRVEREITPDMIRKNAEKNYVRCADPLIAELMVKEIKEAVNKGRSVYSIVEGIALNVPVGLGGHTFDSLKGDLARYLMLIPGAKAVSFGAYAGVWRGEEIPHDEYRLRGGKIVTTKNTDGGVVGGLTNGSPIRCQVVFKAPFPGARGYKTVNIKTMEEVDVEPAKESHDPCLAPRAVPVVEAMMANCLADHAMRAGAIAGSGSSRSGGCR